MRTPGASIVLFSMLFATLPAPAQDPSPDPQPEPALQSLDGRSFPGRIRAKGWAGLFSVKGTLSFQDGLLVWTAKDSVDSAPYTLEQTNGEWKFAAHVPAEQGAFVDWSGTWDGRSLSAVQAVWNRTEEKDFIHDLFLPDVVTMVFKPKAR